MSRWYSIYSPKLNEEKIVKLFKKFGINKYNFTNDGYGDYDILFEYGLYEYKAEIHEDCEELFVYRKSSFIRGQKGCKEYHTVWKKYHNDVWFNLLKDIKRKNK